MAISISRLSAIRIVNGRAVSSAVTIAGDATVSTLTDQYAVEVLVMDAGGAVVDTLWATGLAPDALGVVNWLAADGAADLPDGTYLVTARLFDATLSLLSPIASANGSLVIQPETNVPANDTTPHAIAFAAPPAPGVVFEARIAASLDDVEQFASGSVYGASSDLELSDDVETAGGTGQTVGLRFTSVDIPVGATITSAYIQFQAKEVRIGTTVAQVRGDASSNAAAFAATTNNVSSRTQTTANVSWTIAPWATVGEAGVDQRTPDLAAIVQQIVDASGWSALNSLAFVITGAGTRTAWAYDGNAAAAPLLHIEYTVGAPVVGEITVSDVTISEGSSGTRTATFTVNRSGTAAFTVDFATLNGTATAGSDYVAAAGSLTFAPGQASQTISVTINGDTAVEPDETFSVTLSNATNGGSISDAIGVGTIANDDALAASATFEKRIAASADDVEQFASGHVYTASSDLELMDDVQTAGGSGQMVGLRFTGVDIPAGATITRAYIQFQAKEVWTGTTTVLIRGDASANAAAFAATTNNVSARALTSASESWTIAPWSAIGAAGVDQRTPDLTSVVQQIVSTSGWAALNSMAFVVTGAGTRTAWAYDGNAAAAPLLHIEYTTGAAPVVGDISIGDVAISEGESGTKSLVFTVVRTGTAAFTINYATANGTATAGIDYAAASGTLAFAEGQSSQTISIPVNGDTTAESDETFLVNLSNATNGGLIADGQAIGTIVNDDASATPVTFEKRIAASADDVEQFASGSVYNGSSDLELTDDIETAGGTGQTVGLRFTGVDIPVGATITKAYVQFQAKEVRTGATSATIRGEASANAAAFATTVNNVSTRAQTSASVGWTIAPWTTTGAAGVDQRTPDLSSVVQQIVDTSGWTPLNSMAFVVTGAGTRTAWAYDGSAAAAPLLHVEYTMTPPVVGEISIGDVSIAEGDSGTKIATFTVSRTGQGAFSVSFATANGTASAGADYVATSGVLDFSYGQATRAISITVNGDTSIEADETLLVNLSNATSNGVIIDAQGVGTISNDDGPGFNHAPSDITLTLAQPLKENVAGAVVGALSASDDAGDTHTYAVNDARFEVVGGQLKLKSGVRLDYERAASIALDITATDQGGLSVARSFTIAVSDVDEVRFAAFGDYGGGSGEQAVANLIAGMNVDFIVTTGDNLYRTAPIDEQIGRYYSNYIGNYVGAYGVGSAINRFFPAIGNHEYEDAAGGPGAINYYNYFTLPDNERYFDYQMGSIHFFSLNSTEYEPDGYKSASAQAAWLQAGLANSDAAFNIVVDHYPPYSSGSEHGSSVNMQWPFESWGATAVLSGHDHDYERVMRDDNSDGTQVPYFVSGLGGSGKYTFNTPVAGSAVRYAAAYGTMLIQASDATITFEFWSVDGALIDTYTIDRQGADPLLADGDDAINGSAASDYMNGLSGADRLEGKGGADMLIGGAGADTFVFNSGFGVDTIADFTVDGASHDYIEFASAVFSDWNAVMNATSDTTVGAVIVASAGNTITLSGVTKAQLLANNGADFHFL